MNQEEYLSENKEQGINLNRINVVIGRKTNVPISKGCYKEDNYWYLYDVNERQDLVIFKKGTEDEIFTYLYLITKGLEEQYKKY